MKKTILSILVILCLILIPSSMIYADLNKDKVATQQQILDFQQKIKDAKGNLVVIIGQIAQVQNKINELQANISQINGEVVAIERSSAAKEEEIIKHQKVYNTMKQDFYLSLRARYEHGNINFVKIVFDISNLTDLINRNEYYRIVKDKEQSKINKIRLAKETLEAQKQELDKMKKTYYSKKISLEAEENQMAVEKSKLDSQKDYFATLSNQYQTELKKQEAALVDINFQIRRSMQGRREFAYAGNGIFTWPVPGHYAITSSFGYRLDPIFGGRRLHKGIDIGAPGGANIVAADYGVVAYAQYNTGGFGKCVVINHGSDLMTLYAHMSNYYVYVGQEVRKGQVIGAVGSTGWSTGNHLHFQVTNKGNIYNEVVDPLIYL